ncbi:hypothetical protein [Neobacillus sp. D3-1R]|uniref:hypothetical protein n=1 Tax=Neobacillus sp. D3-1R TaxID=3445778 RepID=UPI003F9F01F9
MEILYSWGSSIKQNSAVQLFIDSQEFMITFEIGHEEMTVLFQNGMIEITKMVKAQIPQIYIKGNLESIEKLLKGQCSLRELISQQFIIVEATFRKILFLETLFKLAHSDFISEISKNNLTV